MDTLDTSAADGATEIQAADLPAEGQGGEPSSEDKARLRGWKPETEFTGPKDKWVPADEFLRRGEDEPALLKSNLKRLEAKLESQAKTIREFADFASKTEERAYKRAVADLEARQAEAVQAGDINAVRNITREMTELAADAKAGTPAAEAVDPIEGFKERNPWFTDPKAEKAQIWATGLSDKLACEGMDGDAQLKEIERRVKIEFPELFSNPRRDEPGAVEGRTPTPRKAVKSYDNLPPSARAACDRFIKDGFIKSREDYVKNYDWGA